jgi:hypothetical protein
MDEIRFSRQQIERLAARLAALQLPPDDQKLLIAIFSAARNQVSEYSMDRSAYDDLRNQLVDAFIPGESTEFAIYPRVGPTPPTPPVPPTPPTPPVPPTPPTPPDEPRVGPSAPS